MHVSGTDITYELYGSDPPLILAVGTGAVSGLPPPERGLPLRTAVRLIELGYESFIRGSQRTAFFTPRFARDQPAAVE